VRTKLRCSRWSLSGGRYRPPSCTSRAALLEPGDPIPEEEEEEEEEEEAANGSPSAWAGAPFATAVPRYSDSPLYCIGSSDCLPLAWRSLEYPKGRRRMVR
jgi:hypothetical protein